MPDMLRMKHGGAQAIVVWSVSASMEARLFDARATLNWDVPFVGHPAMGTGEIKGLVAKPENWDKVYIIGYQSCSFDASGKLPARTQAFVDSVKGKIELEDTSLWWVVSGVDVINLVAEGSRRDRIERSGRHHRLLEHAEELPRPVRRLHLHAGATQRLSDE